MADGEVRFRLRVDSDMDKLSNQAMRMQLNMEKLKLETDRMIKELERVKTVELPTDEYREIQDQIQKATDKLNGLNERMEKWQEMGKSTNSTTFRSMQYDAEQLRNTIEYANGELVELERTGNAFTIGDPQREAELVNQISLRQLSINELSGRLDETIAREHEMQHINISEQFERLGTTAKKVFKALGSLLSSAIKKMKDFSSHSNSSGNAITKLGTRIANLAKRVFIFSLVTKAFRAMVDGMKEGMQEVAKQDSEFNAVMSDWVTQTNTLKGQCGVVFSEILQIILPAVSQIVSATITAMNCVSQLLAIVSGQKTWKKATSAQKDYASSLDKTASSANSASSALAKFDDLDVLNNSSSGGSGSDSGITFEETPIDTTLEDIDPYEMGKNLADKLADALEDIDWDKVENKAEEAGRKIAEFMNGVFAEERLAKELGQAIAGCVNAGVGFLYGFVDEFNFRQAGTWLGTLVNEGIEDIDKQKMGSLIAKSINGGADFVQGFLDRYEWGSLSKAVATVLNTAINEVDAKKVGETAGGVLNLGIVEASTFLTSTEWKLLGSKLEEFFVNAINSVGQDGDSLGYNIGELLADAINAGTQFLLGVDISEMASALGEFFFDIIDGAIENINWLELINTLYDKMASIFSDIPADFTTGIAEGICKKLGMSDEDIAKLSENAQQAKDIIHIFSINTVTSTDGLKNTMLNAYDAISGKSNQMATDISTDLDGVCTTVSNTAEKTTQKVNEATAKTSSALENHKGDLISIDEAWNDYSKTVDSNTSSASNSVKNTQDSMDALNQNTKVNLDEVGTTINDWFNETVEPCFSTETWNLFSENINTSMTTCLETFMEMWTEQFTTWNENNEELYFGRDVWDTNFRNITDSYKSMWELFSVDWQTNMTTWWETMVNPYFTLEQWTLFGTQMKDGVVGGFKLAVGEMGGILNMMIDLFDSALQKIADRVNEMVDDFNGMSGNFDVSSLSHLSVSSIGHISIPELANGAVIRGGNPFMAMLGDQPIGHTNIETPLDTMVQAFKQALSENGGGNGQATVIMQVDKREFGRAVVEYGDAEYSRIGTKFTK